MKTIKELCDIVRETAFAIRLYHGHEHLEKVYENALTNRLRKAHDGKTVLSFGRFLRSLRSFAAITNPLAAKERKEHESGMVLGF
jgi:hypothetical protein